MPLNYTVGLFAFLLLIPFIILYLRRPKPVEKVIPSLMFLIQDKKDSAQHSFLRKIFRNLIFLLQLAAISMLAFSVAEPVVKYEYNTTVKNKVIIVDASASMQAKSSFGTRFDKAIKEAIGELGDSNSIIVAGEFPTTVIKNAGKGEATSVLRALKPKDTKTNLEAAMFEAENLLQDDNGKIVLVSDFVTTEENDEPQKAKAMLISKGNSIKYLDVGGKASNIGIIDLIITKKNTKVFVKNYNDKKGAITLNLIQNKEIKHKKNLEILPGSMEIVEFPTLTGQSRVEIDYNDDFPLDNIAYISAPLKKNIKVLLITNNKKSFLRNALEASQYIELEVREPPIIEAYNLEHDIIVISEINFPLIPPDVRDMSRFVEKGNPVIIAGQPDLINMGVSDLLPLSLTELANESSVYIKILNEFTKDIELNDTTRYYKATPFDNTVVIAAANADDNAVIAYGKKGNGKLVYYGIFDDESNFKKSYSYPIFWNKLISFLLEAEDIRDYNKKIGGTEYLEYDKTGIYEIDNKKVAINLLDEKESDIGFRNEILNEEKEFNSKSSQRLVDVDVALILITFAIIIMGLEIFYVKWIGEL